MTTKTDKRFMDEFEYYFLKKQINAREILKNEPQYIKRLSRDYQDVCFSFIKLVKSLDGRFAGEG